MSTVKLNINKDTYTAKVVTSDDDMHKGLSGVKSIGDNEGMLFIFKEPTDTFFVMDGMLFPLDFIFIDADGKITKITTAEKDSKENINTDGEVKAVLEINKGKSEGYNIGDRVEVLQSKKDIVPEDEKEKAKIKGEEFLKSFRGGGSLLTEDPNKALKIGDVRYQIAKDGLEIKQGHLHVLDNDGNVMYNMGNGSRIFSIPDTRDMFKAVLVAQEGDEEDDIKLGSLVVDILNRQENQEEQFVKK